MRAVYNLTDEPRQEVYRGLIDCSLDYCNVVLLVVRHSIQVGESASQVLEELRPFLINQSEEAEWPGTRLLQDRAAVYRFRLCSDTASILKKAATGLFGWVQPGLPQDLCLVRSDGSLWLVTIAHEQDAYLELSLNEESELRSKIPGLPLASSHDV